MSLTLWRKFKQKGARQFINAGTNGELALSTTEQILINEPAGWIFKGTATITDASATMTAITADTGKLNQSFLHPGMSVRLGADHVSTSNWYTAANVRTILSVNPATPSIVVASAFGNGDTTPSTGETFYVTEPNRSHRWVIHGGRCFFESAAEYRFKSFDGTSWTDLFYIWSAANGGVVDLVPFELPPDELLGIEVDTGTPNCSILLWASDEPV